LLRGQLADAITDLGERHRRRSPVRGADAEAGRRLTHEAGHSHHEELVEVRGEDRRELEALEKREVGICGKLEHPRVELEPRELAVQQPLGALGPHWDRTHPSTPYLQRITRKGNKADPSGGGSEKDW
jgi:hypothetical protein